MKMESFVMPAWMAGIQVCRMRPETSMSAWIPALHAGMTETRSRTKTDRGPPPFLFSKEDTKVSDISDSKCRGLRGEFASSKGQPPGGAPTDLKGEFFASFGLLAIKSSLLRALRVLRGENFFTVKPEEAIF
jgi:hypothetical protein